MKYMSSQEVRETWLNFFKERGHMIEPGASLIPNNDPSLLWINAGVAALKKYFDGSEVPDCKRITNVQKCIRTNDIDNVGRTARHHTFFEMLGNFSIGDYFRKEIVEWAFDILTNDKYFGMDKDKLYVTYHPTDLETRELWIKQGMNPEHLIPLEGNFWQIGEGPCGPNTEVFFDRGEKWDPKHLGIELLKQDIENDRYIEIWGIVFSQFNAVNGVKREDYKELPHKNIDTGAGLERICCVLQNTDTNFETDLFMPIIKATEKLAHKPYNDQNLMPYRVIADHIRACTFALADGANFSNEGRGYVLRRILRRAMRYAQKIGLFEPFLYKLVDSVIEVMHDFYPYLEEKKDYIQKIIKNEEERFIKTLNSGESILNSYIKDTNKLSGELAFKLYDTFGFPIELTIEICADNNVSVDIEGFNTCLEKQKELARSSRKNIESFNKQSKDLLEFKETSDYTYAVNDIKAKVLAVFKDGVKVDSLDEEGDVIFDKTNFYAEMGGQVADTGKIENKESSAEVVNVIKAPNKQHLHHIKMLYGTLKAGDEVTLIVDKKKHFAIEKNHSATHLLQSALIAVLGDECHQKGSFVNEDYLRFDFSFLRKIEPIELKKVERLVNEYIAQGIEEKTLVLPIEEAKKVGAISLFDEKYGDEVRVVSMGDENGTFSRELCGGTHVSNTGEIGYFNIVSESAVAAGVRRIECVTGRGAEEYVQHMEDKLHAISQILKSDFNNLESRIKQLLEDKKKLENDLLNLKKSFVNNKAADNKDSFEVVNGIKFVAKAIPDVHPKELKSFIDEINKSLGSGIVVLGTGKDGKASIVVGVTPDLTNKYSAVDLVKIASSAVGGQGGGGRPDMAQAGGPNGNKLEDAFTAVKQAI